MNPLRLSQIAQFAGASLESGDGNVVINRISTDSRTIKSGELFVACTGKISMHTISWKPLPNRAPLLHSLIATGTGMFQKILR